MKTIFASSLLAFANAAVHPFMAESNFICGLCQQ